jgi:hypothetical protein
MQSQDNPMIQMNSGDKSQPLKPGQYYPLYPNQNSQTGQCYQSPQQIQNQNNNLTNSQQIGPNKFFISLLDYFWYRYNISRSFRCKNTLRFFFCH